MTEPNTLTKADEIVMAGKVPDQFAEPAAEITQMVKHAFEVLANTPDDLVPHTMPIGVLKRLPESMIDEYGINDAIVAGALESPEEDDDLIVQLVDNEGNPVMRRHPLHHNAEHHGLHAYRYEVLSDDSVIAIYANDPSGQIKLKSFANLETASFWSPRNERSA
jgi:hypothetical protein